MCSLSIIYFTCFTVLVGGLYSTDSSIVTTVTKTINRVYRKVGQFVGFKESCSEGWIKTDTPGLELYLSQELLGQPIAQKVIPFIFDQHWQDRLLHKHLILCFYGTPGTGKTFTTKLLNNYIFSQGDKSYYYLFFSGSQSHLPQDSLKKLKNEMKESIEDALAECPYTIIVFDEADLYPPGYLDDLILPFFDRKRFSNEKATFIFLTNIGSNKVLDKSLEIHNHARSFTLKDFEPINKELINESQDSFFKSRIVQLGYITNFIPFLPHKMDSFSGCIQRALANHFNYEISDLLKSQIMRDINKEVSLIPKHDPVFISHGCKRVDSLIAREIARMRRSNNKHVEF